MSLYFKLKLQLPLQSKMTQVQVRQRNHDPFQAAYAGSESLIRQSVRVRSIWICNASDIKYVVELAYHINIPTVAV